MGCVSDFTAVAEAEALYGKNNRQARDRHWRRPHRRMGLIRPPAATAGTKDELRRQ